MKKLLEYSDLINCADSVSAQLKANYPEAYQARRIFLFAVARGGLTFGHLVSQRMNLPIGVIYPLIDHVHAYHPTHTADVDDAVFVYLEDVIAEGRTFNQIMDWHKRMYSDYVKAEFVPVVVDAKVAPSIRKQVNIQGTVTEDWIVFPYEDPARMTEGDRGLFRDRSSQASKDL